MGIARLRRVTRAVAVRGLAPVRAAVLGGIAVVALSLILAALAGNLSHAAQALVLVVPVVATAALGGRRPAQLVAGLATFAFLLLLPPAGSIRVHFTDDVVALLVFMIVAFTVGGLVAVRVEVLGELERQRAALLRSVSHDLRTPLTAISAAVSELLEESLHGPAARARLLALVGQEADRLDRLVGDLLSLARIEGGGLSSHLEPVDLGELVATCIAGLELRSAGTEIVAEIAPDLPSVRGDYALLQQVVTNLLDNAVRHSPPGEPVGLLVRRERDDVRIVVSDAGEGIAPEEISAIFEPFRSGRTAGASGIGLAICKAAVTAHGGSIDVRESATGGAAFTVTLPLR